MGSNKPKCTGRNWGPLLVLISQVLSGLMNLCVKILETEFSNPISPFNILKVRMILTLNLSLIYCWVKNIDDFPAGPRGVRWLMIWRSAGGCCGAIGFYYSLDYLPLSEASMLNLLAPLGCCLASAVLMRGGVSKVQFGAVVTSSVAVLITLHPKFISQHLSLGQDVAGEDNTKETGSMLTGIMFALLGAFGGTCAYTSIRFIGTRAHPLISVNYFAATMIAVSSIAILLQRGSSQLEFDLLQGALLVGIGIFGFLQEFILTSGLSIEPSSSSTLFIFSQVLFAGLLDWVFWGIIPQLTSVIGGLMLILSLAAVLMDKSTETRSRDYEEKGTSRIYNWFLEKVGRKEVDKTDLESVGLASLLISDDDTSPED
ncbi:hypothetical protein LA080_010262 [Diaporthe eres]|nr:hypothetical protein LA080_010262 [Diaporthe eres]